jgi:hypothetical protein
VTGYNFSMFWTKVLIIYSLFVAAWFGERQRVMLPRLPNSRLPCSTQNFGISQKSRAAMISLSMRSAAVPRRGTPPESPYILRQIPDVFVRFDFSKSWHPAQANSIFNYPEQFPIGILLYFG